MNTRAPDASVCLSPEGICVATTSRERMRSRFMTKFVVIGCSLLTTHYSLLFKLRLNHRAKRVVQGLAFEAVQNFFEEAEGEELVRRFPVDAAGLEIKLLLGVNPAAGCAVRAANIVRLNLETRQRIGFS